MSEQVFRVKDFDKSDPQSIYEYSRHLIGHSLHSLLGDSAISHRRKGKGGLGQMVEELFFGYDVNSNQEADFADAHLELKCTPLLKSEADGGYRIKERLVCTMIDYAELIATSFEDSHLLSKCRLMLLLFYLHVSGREIYDYEFLFRVLWQLPEKDLLLIKKDYETIADKVRRGEAHLLSEGDTVYLGACRKGQKGDAPQSQPCSPIKANKRAFSLKPAYMRYILNHVIGTGQNHYSNFSRKESPEFELVKAGDLADNSFEDVILSRFKPFIGCDYTRICRMLGRPAYQAKSKYADICGLIASDNAGTRLSKAEEFIKSGITLKTVRLRPDGMPKESMSFKNINYCEVADNDEWTDSEAYELFTTRFIFAVFKPVSGQTITVHNNHTGGDEVEQSYVLDNVFFWTMPAEDLGTAHQYWLNIRENVLRNNIRLDAFWSIADHRKFHVRPKAVKASQLAINPNGGKSPKFCYWFNADYVKTIIDNSQYDV